MRFLATLLLALGLGTLEEVKAGILYSVTDLGSLNGTGSVGLAVNNAGQVTGYSFTVDLGSVDHAFLYKNGEMTDLGTLGGGSSFSYGEGINNAGQVVGWSNTAGFFSPTHAFLYSSGQMIDVGLLLGRPSSAGYAINDAGQLVGWFDPPAGVTCNMPGCEHAFLYRSGQVTDLGTLGGPISEAFGINNAGQVVGESYTGTVSQNVLVYHAFLYSRGNMTDLGTLGGPTSEARAINDAGLVVGQSNTVNGFAHAFLYNGGQMIDLGTLPGYANSYAYSINDAGQIVGQSATSSGAHAFLYSNGEMTDLNDVIDPALGITLTDATAINDNGQIVANGYGESDAFLLTPISNVPEPSTLALLSIALAALLAWSRRGRVLDSVRGPISTSNIPGYNASNVSKLGTCTASCSSARRAKAATHSCRLRRLAAHPKSAALE